jgi:hypothetical protein
MLHDERADYDDELWKKRRTPEQLVKPLVFALYGCGWLYFVLALAWIALFLVFLIDPESGPSSDPAINVLIATWFIGTCTLWSACFFRGAYRLALFRSYWAVLLAAALAVLPAAFPHAGLLTVPIGVWAIVVLLRQNVRGRFVENRGRPLPESSERHARRR